MSNVKTSVTIEGKGVQSHTPAGWEVHPWQEWEHAGRDGREEGCGCRQVAKEN